MIDNPTFEVITGLADDSYEARVQSVYQDDPEIWRTAIGEQLWFQFGLYDGEGTRSLDEAGERYFARQLDLAGFPKGAPVGRILDVGFGWGATLMHLVHRFPDCPRIDGINISARQVRYTAGRLSAAGEADRVRLYLCNAQDIDLLPESQPPYDLVVLRGSIGHMTSTTLEGAMKAIAARTRPQSTVVISETLYTIPLAEYQSAIPDHADRLACGHRKTLDGLLGVLERNSFAVSDVRELPSGPEAIRWLNDVKTNVDLGIAAPLPRPFEELRDVADNLSVAFRNGTAGVYSIVARRVS